jgi:hypothetical protein
MKEYYRVKYSDYGYDEMFEKYNLFYKGYKIEIESYSGSITLKKYKLFSDGVRKLIRIPTIIEYDTNTKRYYDIITGEEYIETIQKKCDQYLVNKGGNLEICLNKSNELSVNKVAETLRELTPFKIEVYSIAMSNLKKTADERARNDDNERKRSENYIETFKRNRKK